MNNKMCLGISIIRVPKKDYIDATNKSYDEYINSITKSKPNGKEKNTFVNENNKHRKEELKKIEDNYSKVLYETRQIGTVNENNIKSQIELIMKDPSGYVYDKELVDNSMVQEITNISMEYGSSNFQKFQEGILNDDFISYYLIAPSVLDFTFENNSSELSEVGRSQLNNLRLIMYLNPDMNVLLVGHTDNIGNPISNIKLSLDRANSCKSFLIEKGISPKRIGTDGKGDSQPRVKNNENSGTEANRRIDIIQQ